MLDHDTKKSFGITSAILAWLVLFSTMANFAIMLLWQRDISAGVDVSAYSQQHMSVGLLILLLVSLRLLWWLVNPRLKAPRNMPENAYGLSRLSLLCLYLALLGLTASGLFASWVSGVTIEFFGLVDLAPLAINAAEGSNILIAARQLHQGFTLFGIAALTSYALINIYYGRRYKLGLRRMLPGLHA